jgi:hypothetical protein
MHKFLRSIGFSNLTDEDQVEILLRRAVNEKYRTRFIAAPGDKVIEQYQLQVAPSVGIAVVGTRDSDGTFRRDYYFPYMRSYDGTLTEEGSIERHAEHETFAGVLDDYRAGITLIFYVTNSLELREITKMNMPVSARQAFLSGLATEGKILLPVEKSEEDTETIRRRQTEERKLYEAARQGDQDAIDTLTETDMEIMDMVQKRIETEDLYTLVESTFMPTGVECDMYAIVGEILAVRTKQNVYSHENIVDLKLNCNDCVFHVCINEKDLLGEPAVGRRFKGKIWMQGELEVVEDPQDDAEM